MTDKPRRYDEHDDPDWNGGWNGDRPSWLDNPDGLDDLDGGRLVASSIIVGLVLVLVLCVAVVVFRHLGVSGEQP